MKRLTIEEFGGEEYTQKSGQEIYSAMDWIENCETDYHEYLNLTDKEIERFHLLAKHVGEYVLLDRGRAGKSKMYIVCVQLNPDEKHPDPHPDIEFDEDRTPIYISYPYTIRLNYRDHLTNTKREWSGIWVKDPMKITLESEILELINNG